MRTVVYAYIAVVFGGALVTVIFMRAECSGWPSLTVPVVGGIVFVLARRGRAGRPQDGDAPQDRGGVGRGEESP